MKLKKHLIMGLTVVTMALGVVGCGSNSSQNKLSDIKKKGTLVIGTSADYAPYEFHKEVNGKDTIVGFDIMIAQDIAKDLGVKLEIKDMKFDGLLGALQSNKVDMVVAGMSPTDERKKAVDFSNVYYTGENVVLVNKENASKYTKLADLKDANIGAQKSSIQEGLAKDTIKATKIKSLTKLPDLVLELNNKNVDAVVISKNTADAYLKQYPNIVAANISDMKSVEEGSAIAVKKSNNKDLVNALNKTLDKLAKDKTVDKYVDEATKLSQEK